MDWTMAGVIVGGITGFGGIMASLAPIRLRRRERKQEQDRQACLRRNAVLKPLLLHFQEWLSAYGGLVKQAARTGDVTREQYESYLRASDRLRVMELLRTRAFSRRDSALVMKLLRSEDLGLARIDGTEKFAPTVEQLKKGLQEWNEGGDAGTLYDLMKSFIATHHAQKTIVEPVAPGLIKAVWLLQRATKRVLKEIEDAEKEYETTI